MKDLVKEKQAIHTHDWINSLQYHLIWKLTVQVTSNMEIRLS